ncbi:MAG: hypothetical protein ABID54_10430 [Pseudomonadota bacterium]
MANTRVLSCDCSNEYQDRKYGKYKRLHNQCKLGNSIGWRCTICKKVRD